MNYHTSVRITSAYVVPKPKHQMDQGLVSEETAVLRQWGVETNVWFIIIIRVDN